MANPRSTIRIGTHPVHPMIVPFVIAFYIGAFVADIAFAGTADPFWARAAFWLISAGIVMSVIAATIGFIDFAGEPLIRALPSAWWHFGANALVAVISIIDWILRYNQGIEFGSHAYIWLTLIVALLLVFSGWMGGQMVYRDRVAVADE